MAYTRRDVSTLTASERRRFVKAVLEVKRRGEYDEFVRLPVSYFAPDGERGLRAAHLAPSCLPWHRRFLRRQHRPREARYLPASPPGPGNAQHGRILARHRKLPPWDVTPDALEDVGRIYRYA